MAESHQEFLELESVFRTFEEASAKLPDVLAKQKNKFLTAISKNSSENSWSKEDDDFVKKVSADSLMSIVNLFKPKSQFWDDTKASNEVKNKIEQNSTFLLHKYLECAKIIFLVYSGTHIDGVEECLDYVLTHARQFGDPSQPIFTTNNFNENLQSNTASGTESIHSHDTSITSSLPSSKFMNRIEQLIKDLKNSYDEGKFRMLNVNVTYIALLMLRRTVKNETEFQAALKRIQTHDNYVKLCPWPLDNLLPKSDTSQLIQSRLKTCAYLAIHAYINVPDTKTKRILQGTCVQYMEWCGLQLPHLYFKVVNIYQIEAGELWDLLSTKQNAESLIQLADDYYEHK